MFGAYAAGSLGDLFDSALEAGLASTLYSSPVQQAAADGASSSSAGAGSSSGSAGVQAPEGSADWFGSLWSADEYEAESQAQTNFTQAEETVTSFDDLRKQADLASTGAGTDDGGPAPAPANGGAAGRRQQASAEAAGNAEAASQAGAQSLFMPNVMAQAVQRASDAAGSVLGNGGTEDPAGAAAGLGQGGFTADINSRMRQGLGAVMEGLSSAEADPRAKSTSDLFGALADEMEKMMRMQHLLLYDPPTGVPRTTPDPDSVL